MDPSRIPSAVVVIREVLKFGLVIESERLLRAATAHEGLVTAIDEGCQSDKKGVNEPIFVRQMRFLAEDVEKLGRDDLLGLLVVAQNQVRMLREVLDGLVGYALGQLDRQDLLDILDRHRRIAYDQIKVRKGVLDLVDPFGVDGLMHGLPLESGLGVGRADDQPCIGVIGALLRQVTQSGERLRSKVFIFLIHSVLLSFLFKNERKDL